MGYYTRYSLELKCLKDQKEVEQINIENVMKKVKVGSSTEEILKDLELIKNGKENAVIDEDSIFEDLRATSEDAKYAIDEDGNSNDSCKWYESTNEILSFSKKYPNWLFTLTGEGEESGDMWKKYFLNGKVQEAKAKITFDEFDEKKLKKIK